MQACPYKTASQEPYGTQGLHVCSLLYEYCCPITIGCPTASSDDYFYSSTVRYRTSTLTVVSYAYRTVRVSYVVAASSGRTERRALPPPGHPPHWAKRRRAARRISPLPHHRCGPPQLLTSRLALNSSGWW